MLYVTYEIEFRKFANHIAPSDVGIFADAPIGTEVTLHSGTGNYINTFATNALISDGAAALYTIEHTDDSEQIQLNDFADAADVAPTMTLYPGTFVMDTQTCTKVNGLWEAYAASVTTGSLVQTTALDPDDVAANFVVPEGGTLSIVPVEGHGNYLSLSVANSSAPTSWAEATYSAIANAASRYLINYFHPKGLPAVAQGDTYRADFLVDNSGTQSVTHTLNLEDVAWEVLKVSADWAISTYLGLPQTSIRELPKCATCRQLMRHSGQLCYQRRKPTKADAWHFKCVNGKLVCTDPKPKYANKHAHLPDYDAALGAAELDELHSAHHRRLAAMVLPPAAIKRPDHNDAELLDVTQRVLTNVNNRTRAPSTVGARAI
jgi:hypothetical protein